MILFVVVFQMLLMVLTFGLSSPILAVVAFIAVMVDMSCIMLFIELYLNINPRCTALRRDHKSIEGARLYSIDMRRAASTGSSEIADMTGSLSGACEGVCEVLGLLCWSVVAISSGYWAIMTFDMVGNMQPNDYVASIWAPIAALSIPAMFYTVSWLMHCWRHQHRNQSPSIPVAEEFGVVVNALADANHVHVSVDESL